MLCMEYNTNRINNNKVYFLYVFLLISIICLLFLCKWFYNNLSDNKKDLNINDINSNTTINFNEIIIDITKCDKKEILIKYNNYNYTINEEILCEINDEINVQYIKNKDNEKLFYIFISIIKNKDNEKSFCIPINIIKDNKEIIKEKILVKGGDSIEINPNIIKIDSIEINPNIIKIDSIEINHKAGFDISINKDESVIQVKEWNNGKNGYIKFYEKNGYTKFYENKEKTIKINEDKFIELNASYRSIDMKLIKITNDEAEFQIVIRFNKNNENHESIITMQRVKIKMIKDNFIKINASNKSYKIFNHLAQFYVNELCPNFK